MPDWPTIASTATAAGTLVLALATFSSVRSANRSARVAEQALQLGLRPVLLPSREQDPSEKVLFADGHFVHVRGSMAAVEHKDGVVYLALPLRNVGSGLAGLHGWHLTPERVLGRIQHADPEDFRMLQRDLYVPPGDIGYWQGALRDAEDPVRPDAERAIAAGDAMTIELLYADHEGGQRTISRFAVIRRDGTDWFASVSRHWRLDGFDPRG